jgi:hypothetical protein
MRALANLFVVFSRTPRSRMQALSPDLMFRLAPSNRGLHKIRVILEDYVRLATRASYNAVPTATRYVGMNTAQALGLWRIDNRFLQSKHPNER